MLFALIPFLTWGLQNVLIKISSNKKDNFELKIPICYSIIAIILFTIASFLSESGESIFNILITNKLMALTYLIFFIITYIDFFGAQFLEASIFSTLENLEGTFTIIMLIIYFLFNSDIQNLQKYLTLQNLLGITICTSSLIILAILQNKYAKEENDKIQNMKSDKEVSKIKQVKKYGAWAFIFPITYCLFDAFSSFIDTINLGGVGEAQIGNWDYIRMICCLYFILGCTSYVMLYIKEKRLFNPFKKYTIPFFLIACCELIAGTFYPFAMQENALLTILACNSYGVLSIILSRIFLKEKLQISQYITIFFVLLGIIIILIN